MSVVWSKSVREDMCSKVPAILEKNVLCFDSNGKLVHVTMFPWQFMTANYVPEFGFCLFLFLTFCTGISCVCEGLRGWGTFLVPTRFLEHNKVHPKKSMVSRSLKNLDQHTNVLLYLNKVFTIAWQHRHVNIRFKVFFLFVAISYYFYFIVYSQRLTVVICQTLGEYQ